MSRAESETVIRWDCEDRVPVMYEEAHPRGRDVAVTFSGS